MVADVLFIGILFLIVFISLYTFKRWFGIDILHNNSAMQRVNAKPPVLDVVNVDNPFSVELGTQPFANDYFCMKVATKRTCDIRTFWNVNLTKAIDMFKSAVSKHQTASSVHLTDYLIKCSTLQNEKEQIHPTFEEPYSYVFHVDNMDNIMEEETISSSEVCPLVVSIELPTNACSEAVLNEDIVCLLSIFDKGAKINSDKGNWTVHYQIIQTADGRLFTLKNLFASGVPNLDAAATATSFENYSHPDLCIVCHTNHVTRALLPCRHQCICGACVRKTKLCPICRSHVTSYLVTCDESHLSMPLPDEEELAEQTREGLSGMGLIELIKAIWNAS